MSNCRFLIRTNLSSRWHPGQTVARLGLIVGVVFAAGIYVPASRAQAQTYPVGTLASDNFSRATGSSWGASEIGGAYTVTGMAQFSVADGQGVIAQVLPGKSATAKLQAVAPADVLMQTVLMVPSVPADRLGVHAALQARQQKDGSVYRGRLRLTKGGTLAVSASRSNGPAESSLGSVNLPLRVSAGEKVRLQMQVAGQNPVVVKVRVALASSTMPNWQIVASDSAINRITAAGAVGLWDYVSASSVPTTFRHDSFFATVIPASYRVANFDTLPIGKVTPSGFNGAVGATNTNSAAYDDMTVVPDSRGRGRVIRTVLKAGTIHSSNGGDSGDNLFIKLPNSYDKACIEYDIRFDNYFDWSLGGKLPGLEGVAPGVAPSVPTGGKNTTQGWSGRLMWLTPKSYSWAGPTNMAVSYMYHPGQAGTYGDNVRWNRGFTAGKWHTVKQCYVMNTVGKANGVLQAWMDGQLVVNHSDYVYRVRADVHINYLVFSLFRGGNTLAWAGARDNYVDIDNIAITSS